MKFTKIVRSKYFVGGALICLLLFGVGVWLLLNPANPFNSMFRSEVTDTHEKVVTGPYPVEEDFKNLRKKGVKTIVSLLDPRLPYESVLLERERELAKRHGLRVLNFPMASVLGQRLGTDYASRVQAAADSIIAQTGRVYLHCYLGVHRGRDVEAAVKERGIATAGYDERNRTESETNVLAAEEAYASGDFQRVIALIAQTPEPGERGTLVESWAYYRLNENEKAADGFRKVVAEDPASVDGHLGLGYASLKLNDLATAESCFTWARNQQPDNLSIRQGLGLVHYRKGELAEARPHLEAYVKENPDNAEIALILERIEKRSQPAMMSR